MNKEQLEIAKKIAEIDGVKVHTLSYINRLVIETHADVGPDYIEYDPLSWSILGPLMVKYHVTPDYSGNAMYIIDENTNESSTGILSAAYFKDEDGIPQAILECIIKSKENNNV